MLLEPLTPNAEGAVMVKLDITVHGPNVGCCTQNKSSLGADEKFGLWPSRGSFSA